MLRPRLVVIATLLVALGGCRRGATSPVPSGDPGVEGGALEIVFTYGSEKEAWVKQVTEAFNRQARRTRGGRPVRVRALPMGSGECLEELLDGTRRAHLTSPASSAFIKLGNAQSRARFGRDLVARTDNLLLSPVVIATWKPMAEALGWGRAPLGWSDVLALSREPRGWAARGFPQWGSFKFGHTHPESSNSGLMALFAEVYAATGKRRDLQLADLQSRSTADFVAAIERSVVHYGSSTGFFGRRMFEGGPSYLSAAVLYENMVVEAYGPGHSLPFPLVAIYPKEGTFWSDHPAGIVEREWVGPEEREAAQLYLDYLLAPEQQRQALPFGFRPASVEVPLGPPIDAAHGVDPKEPQTTLEVPSVEVMDAALRLFRDNKRRSNVTLVLDLSGSMNEEHGARLANAKAGALQFLEGLGDGDRFSLLTFSNQATWVEQGVQVGPARPRLRATIESLYADGRTALYDAVELAYRRHVEEAASQAERISALVVLTDGEDTSSRLGLDELLRRLRFDSETRPVRIFTIAYGPEAGQQVLARISETTAARSYSGDPQSIRKVFRDIATFF